jgi:hypothetical protein
MHELIRPHSSYRLRQNLLIALGRVPPRVMTEYFMYLLQSTINPFNNS